MKKLLFILFFLTFSCVPNKNSFDNTNNKYKIFKEEKKLDVTIFHAYNKIDTLVFLIKNNELLNCSNRNYISKKNSLEEIYFYNYQTDTIFFYHEKKDLNNGLKINSGHGKPWKEKEVVKTYKSNPYLLKDCEPLTFDNIQN